MLSVFFFHLRFWWSDSWSFAIFLAGVLFFLGSVCAINFRVRTFVFCFFFCGLVFFGGVLPMFFFCLRISCKLAPEMPSKNSLHVRSCFFWFVLSVLGSGLTTSLLFLFLLLFSFQREISGLTGHHTPPPARVVCCFSFFFLSPPHWLVRLFWPCVPSVLAFLRGAILGPRVFFWILSGLL